MSDFEAEKGMTEQGEKDEDEDSDDFSPTIVALPPKVMKQEESQIEVSFSPAFQCLEEVGISTLCCFISQ